MKTAYRDSCLRFGNWNLRFIWKLWFGIFVPLLVWISLAVHSPAQAQEYDLVLRGGKIVDGTGAPWFYGDVAVRGDRIVAVGREVPGKAGRVINAEGLVVAPGFIDIHSHSDWVLLEDGDAQGKIRQGVTTEILGEGSSAGPSKGKLPPMVAPGGDGSVSIRQLGDYFDAVERAGVSVNIASYVGLNSVWQSVMGRSFDRPKEEDIEAMRVLVGEAMEEGALGLSSQLMMPPGLLATTDEVVKLCEIVHEHGGIYSTHIRNEGLGVLESVSQAIEIGERAEVPVDIIHLKIADEQLWGRMDEVVALIEAARIRGVNVQANVYPYTRGNNNLSSIIPPWAHEGGRAKMLARLADPLVRAKMKEDIVNGVEGWYNHYTAVGGDWGRMLVSGENRFKGMTMDVVMAERIKGRETPVDLLDELFDFLIEEKGSVGTVYAHHTEEDMNLALVQPWCSVGSDGSAFAVEGRLRRGNPHPRNFGTFPRLLGRYVRERELLELEEAVRKITSLNAAKVGMRGRGLLVEGYHADITVFDPVKVGDRATFNRSLSLQRGNRVCDREWGSRARRGDAHRGAAGKGVAAVERIACGADGINGINGILMGQGYANATPGCLSSVSFDGTKGRPNSFT